MQVLSFSPTLKTAWAWYSNWCTSPTGNKMYYSYRMLGHLEVTCTAVSAAVPTIGEDSLCTFQLPLWHNQKIKWDILHSWFLIFVIHFMSLGLRHITNEANTSWGKLFQDCTALGTDRVLHAWKHFSKGEKSPSWTSKNQHLREERVCLASVVPNCTHK